MRKAWDISEPIDNSKSGYVATLNIIDLLSVGENPSRPRRPGTGMMLGIKRPYYRLGRDIRVVGTIDFKMNKALAGIDNLATVVFGYDLRKNKLDRTVKMDMMILNVSFRILIPFSAP